MSLFRKMRHIFHDDWCNKCYAQMDVTERRLFALPTMYVGHYVTHTDAAYYIKNMVPIEKKADIPTGVYACGVKVYRCPKCGHRAALLTVFLPVRDMEKPEDAVLFENGELDGVLYQ